MTYQPFSRHAGLGTAGAARNHAPANLAPQEKYSLFLGNISDGVDDFWLEKVLATAGALMSVKRIKDANGVPKTFGFAEYADADSVLRCLELLNGTRLPGKNGADAKPLTVKADDKTRARLDEYELDRPRQEVEQALQKMEAAQNALRDTLDEMASGDASDSPAAVLAKAQEEARKRGMMQHLQDLGPEDLPAESRGVITREIQFFRERAAKREADKKAAEHDKNRNAGLAEAHFGNRAANLSSGPAHSPSIPAEDRGSPYQDRRNDFRNQQGQQQPPRGPRNFQSDNGYGSRGQRRDNGYENNNRFNGDRRSWGQQDRTPQFVRSNGTGIGESYERDRGNDVARRQNDAEDDEDISPEEAERKHREHVRRESEQRFREKERKWEAHERSRQQNDDREKLRDIALQKDEDAQRLNMAAKLAEWNDQEEIDRGKEMYHVDRTRWRAQRRVFRQREAEADAKDEEAEAARAASLDRASTDFLTAQSDLFSEGEAKKPKGNSKASTPMPEETNAVPIKLSVAAVQHSKKPEPKPVEMSKAKPAAFNAADETEEGPRRKRELVTLTYSDDEAEDEDEVSMTEREKQQRRAEKIKSLVDSIPTDKDGLWAREVRWDKLSNATIDEKMAPFASKKVAEALGAEEEELATLVVDHIKAHKSAQALVDELEPVLADEATEFVIKIWRFLIFETLASTHRIKTSAV